jgi:NAD(P)-dependent dehydrogenase (short-subunit alcohol dehydrogenase family)
MSEVVVITGASAGVGRATARRFAMAGSAVALLARGSDGLEAAAADVREFGGQALPIAVDVSDAAAVGDAARRVEAELGPIDIWINDAMVTVFSPVWEMTPEEFRRVTEVTYLGFVHGTMAALEHMLPRNRGTIVQVGSALAYQSIPLQSAYCGAKFGIRGFTQSVRAELFHERKNIHIAEVHLPGINTPQFMWCRTHLERRPQPVPPIFEPEVPAQAIFDAAHAKRQEVLLGVPTLRLVAGSVFAPWLMRRITARRAWDQQMTEQHVSPTRPDDLFHAVPGDKGAHGPFDDGARRGTVVPWLSKDTRVRALGWAAIAATLGFGVKVLARDTHRNA